MSLSSTTKDMGQASSQAIEQQPDEQKSTAPQQLVEDVSTAKQQPAKQSSEAKQQPDEQDQTASVTSRSRELSSAGEAKNSTHTPSTLRDSGKAQHEVIGSKSFLRKKPSSAHKTTKSTANGKSVAPVTSTLNRDKDEVEATSSHLLQEASLSTLELPPSASIFLHESQIYDGHSNPISSNGLDSSSFTSDDASYGPETITVPRRATSTEYESLFFPADASTPEAPRRKRRMPEVKDDTIPPPQPLAKKPKASRKLGANRREDHRSAEDIQENGGIFTHEEVATFEAWLDWCCNAYEFTKAEVRECLLQKSHKNNKDLRNFYDDLYDRFPNRKQDAVRKFARRQISEKRGSKWTDSEDDMIRSLMARADRPTYQEIGLEIGRFEEDVRNRWRDKLAPGAENASKGRWTQTETLALYRAMARCTRDAKSVIWPQIASTVGTRSRVQCTTKWTALARTGQHALKLSEARRFVEAEVNDDS